MTTMTYTEELEVVTCWCGMAHAIPRALYRHMVHKRDNNQHQPDVYCPMGHTWIVSGESKLDRTLRIVREQERTIANLDETVRSERAAHATTKGQLTKARKRADRGVCQHCNRSFVNVARHVATKHPGVTP